MDNRGYGNIGRNWIGMTKRFVIILTVYSCCGLNSVSVLGTWVYGFIYHYSFSYLVFLLKSEKYTWAVFIRR